MGDKEMLHINRTTKKTQRIIYIILTCLTAGSVGAEPPGRWDGEPMAEEHIAFCDTYMPGFLEIREKQGDTAALEELERIYKLAEEQFDDAWFFHRVIWFEAQAYSGKEDEAWAQVLYEYLFERDVVNNPKRTCSCKLHPPDYILCNNIMAACVAQGKAARAREYCLKIEDSLMTERKFDLSGTSYADKGPIFTFLDDARDRDYPIFMHDLNQTARNQNEADFIHYPNIYALGTIADTAVRSGDWIKAAELSAWSIRYADEYMKGDRYMRGEIGRVASYDAYKRLANLALLHGYPEEAARFIREFMPKAEGYFQTGEWDVLLAKLDLAVIRIQTGELTEEDLVLADEADKEITGNWWNPRGLAMQGTLNKARVYYALGHKREAWQIVDDLMDRAANDVNPHHWVELLTTAIDLALADGAVRPELEEWLVLALDNARRTGNKFDELPLYENYARFLEMQGRYSEAIQIQQEAVRLSGAMNLPKRSLNNQDLLAAYRQRLENLPESRLVETDNTPSETNVVTTTTPSPEVTASADGNQRSAESGAVNTPAVDIQPGLSHSASLPSQPAYGRFYVYNPSFTDQKGTLCLTGPIDQVEWQNEHWLTVSASPVFESARLTQSIQLESGTACIIDITGLPLEDGTGAEVLCQWVPEEPQASGVTGSWSYQAAETEKRTAVIDAHQLQNNPFYLIPIHHMVQRIDATDQQIVNYAVEASSPMRIESYDAASGRLLAVDANGDGDFLDGGDLIIGDRDRDNWPDLVFEEGQKLSSLVLYVQPEKAATAGIETELTIKIKASGEWQTDAVDVIKPYASPER